MAVLLKGGVYFLHIPKTGGMWVTKVLNEAKLVQRQVVHIHADLNMVKRHNDILRCVLADISVHIKSRVSLPLKQRLARSIRGGQNGSSMRSQPFTFCFVRNPISWYESWWGYMQRMNWRAWGDANDLHRWHPAAMLNGLGDADFNRFVRNVVEARPGFVTEMYSWYVAPGIGFVGKQENLVEDLIAVLRRLRLSFDEEMVRQLAPLNPRDKSKYTVRWDPGLREEVRRLEYAGMRRLGYSS